MNRKQHIRDELVERLREIANEIEGGAELREYIITHDTIDDLLSGLYVAKRYTGWTTIKVTWFNDKLLT